MGGDQGSVCTRGRSPRKRLPRKLRGACSPRARQRRAGLGRMPSRLEDGRPRSLFSASNAVLGPRGQPRRARGNESLGTGPRTSSESEEARASREERASAFPSTVHGAGSQPAPWPRAPLRVREQVAVRPDPSEASGGFSSGRFAKKSPSLASGTRDTGRGRHRGLRRLARRGVARTARSSARLAPRGCGRHTEDA